MILFPAIDLKEGKCVRLRQGDFEDSTIYNTSPLDQAKIFEGLGIEYLHCVDLDGALTGNFENIKSVEDIKKNTNLKIQFGGGVRDIQSVKRLINIGISNVILGTSAYDNKEFLEASVKMYPSQISIALDIKKNQIATKGWRELKELNVSDFLNSLQNMNINSIICTDVMKDGMKEGINFKLLEDVMGQTNFECVASGGVSNISDIIHLKEKNYSKIKGVIVGKAIYDNNINITEALKILN